MWPVVTVTVKQQPGDAFEQLQVKIDNLKGKVGKVGYLGTQRYPDDPKTGKQGLTVAHVATIMEYGYPAGNIPARPTLLPAIAAKQAEWKKIALDGSRKVLKGHGTIADVMEAIGSAAQGEVDRQISTLTEPPLKQATIAKRLKNRRVKGAYALARKIVNKMPLTQAQQNYTGLIDKPLIDTGYMLATLTHSVEDS